MLEWVLSLRNREWVDFQVQFVRVPSMLGLEIRCTVWAMLPIGESGTG